MIDTAEVCAFYSKHAGTPRCEPGTPPCDRCYRVVQKANSLIATGFPQWAVRADLDGAMKLIAEAQHARLGDAFERS